MLERMDHAWRVFATGLSFALFGIGGLVLRIVVFPLLQLVARENGRRTRYARNVIRWTFRFYIELMRVLGVLRYELRGMDKLEREGLLILANHPTLIDTVFLMAFVKNADCIVKADLRDNPFTHGPVRAAGYVANNDGAGLVSECIASLDQANNLIVFPEGTRTGRDGVIALKRGAANIAIRGRRDITPVLIRCEPATLGKGEKWWKVPSRRVNFRIDVQEDLPVARFIDGTASEVLAARRLNEYLENYFTGKCRNA